MKADLYAGCRELDRSFSEHGSVVTSVIFLGATELRVAVIGCKSIL